MAEGTRIGRETTADVPPSAAVSAKRWTRRASRARERGGRTGIGRWERPAAKSDWTFPALFVVAYLLLVVSVPAATTPAAGVPALALGLLYVLIATVGFAKVEHSAGLDRAPAYFAVQLPLGVAVFLTSHAVGGETAGVFLLLLLAGQGVQVLSPRATAVVGALVGAALVGAGLLMVPTHGWAHGVREATVMLVATVFTVAVSRVAARERRARAELAAANRRLRASAAQAEELATTRERNRLARELHDTLAQGFTGIVLQLEATESALVGGRPEVASQRLDQARILARESLAEARRSVWSLRPQVLERRPLPEALPDAVRALTVGTALAVHVETPDRVPPLSPDLEADVLRVAQEAVTNAVKHAGARTLAVGLGWDGSCLELRVRDDGRGFVARGRPSEDGGGFGLTAMRERIERHGGTLRIDARPGEGSEVVAAVSVPERVAG